MSIDTVKLSTARVVIYKPKSKDIVKIGSAVLINQNTALTARHIVYDVKEEKEVYLEFPHLNGIEPIKVSTIECATNEGLDVAMLNFNTLQSNDFYFPKLYAVKPEYKQSYQSFGFPKDRTEGCQFNGEIIEVKRNYTQNDLELSCLERKEFCYKGASGSPLYIDDGVYGLVIVRDTGYTLGAISFKECTDFFELHKISYEQFCPLDKCEETIITDMLALSKIGFDEDEDLPYIDTYATWKKVIDLDSDKEEFLYSASSLEDMTEKFFLQKRSDKEEKVLYVVADFGKGKSTFLKHLAAKYAKQYKETREGDFPIYFNLRDFKQYDNFDEAKTLKIGCIGEFLKERYNIHIDLANSKPPLLKKSILLLVDSLDECGSLLPKEIKKVMDSVKKTTKFFSKFKLIVTTRPIPNALQTLIKENEPFNNTWEYASVFGFTPEQIEKYMKSLESKLKTSSAYSYNQELIETIRIGKSIHFKFSEILSEDELRRPIIAYMLFKLLEQDYEIQRDNKLEVFLSFINMLTKDAKHISDREKPNHNLPYIHQLSYRNLLYVSAVMWMKDRHLSGGGFLKLKDLTCILGNEAPLVQFMSHSYFKSDNDTYHFNHQSFAEIILAEYYVRIFLWMAVENKSIQEASPFLNIGKPTTQTMLFIKGLIKLLMDASDNAGKDDLLKLRKIRRSIFPLVASLGVELFNRRPASEDRIDTGSDFYMYSPFINSKLKIKQLDGFVEIPDEMLDQWIITAEHLHKMMALCVDIINSDDNYLFFEPQFIKTSFVGVYKITGRTEEFNLDIVRWIAMLIVTSGSECNKALLNYCEDIYCLRIAEMMKLHQTESGSACPEWIERLPALKLDNVYDYQLSGLLLQGNTKISNWNLVGVDLNGLSMKKVEIEKFKLYKASFSGARFSGVNAKQVEIQGCIGKGVEFSGCYIENFLLSDCSLEGMKLHEAYLLNCSFNGVDLRGSELTAIYLINISDFTNVKLGGSKISIKTDKESYDRWKHVLLKNRKNRVEILSESEIEKGLKAYNS